MKNFFKKILIIFFGYILVVQIINFFAPYHWGNPWYSSKIQYLENNNLEKKYNTFIFGSSRVYRQLNPKLIDSLIKKQSSKNINTFNLGSPATFCPQNYYLYENFLNSDLATHAKYAVLELSSIDKMPLARMNEERTFYYQNFSDLLFIYNYQLVNKKSSKLERSLLLARYFTVYFKKLLVPANLKHFILSDDFYKQAYLGKDKTGFLSLEYDLSTNTDSIVINHLVERKSALSKKKILSRKNRIERDYLVANGTFNNIHLKRIHYLISESKKRGIHLFFLVSPRAADEDLIDLSKQIPNANLFDFANPTENDFLYSLENSFDVGHLNDKGSFEYSKLFSERFLEKLKESNFLEISN